MLKGKKPESIQKRLKALFYGTAGGGKTMASIQFPCPYLIDTEKGAENDQYVKLLVEGKGSIFQTCDFDEMLEEVRTLLSEKHDYKTLIIDSLTNVYHDLLDKAGMKVGVEYSRNYKEANKRMRHLCNLLLRLDMNVIITSHAKKEYGDNLKIIGTTYDCYNELDYLFDIVFEIQKRGNNHVGTVKKTRIENFACDEQITFSYDSIAEKYGRQILEKDTIPVELANSFQVSEIKKLIHIMKIPQEICQKWLDKGCAQDFEELTSENIQKIIVFLYDKLKKTGE